MLTAIKVIKRASLSRRAAFLAASLLAVVFTAGSPPISSEAPPALIDGPRTGSTPPVATISASTHSAWFGEVFTNKATFSEDTAKEIASLNPGAHEAEWYLPRELRVTLESLGFDVVRGLSVPEKAELSSFDLLIIPVPNQLNVTQAAFLEAVKDWCSKARIC